MSEFIYLKMPKEEYYKIGSEICDGCLGYTNDRCACCEYCLTKYEIELPQKDEGIKKLYDDYKPVIKQALTPGKVNVVVNWDMWVKIRDYIEK